MIFAQTDPGVQSGNRGTGLPLPSIQSDSPAGILAFFNDGLARFQEVEGVAGSPNSNNGLGPRFNFNQCAGCHVQPAVGGTGPAVNPQFAGFGGCGSIGSLSLSAIPGNPQGVAAGQPTAAQVGTIICNNTNSVPYFITVNGPTREARFPFFFNADGTPNLSNPNGGVEDLFTVAGRPDGAGTCHPAQPGFDAARAGNNIIFRIPTPTFGAGLIENLDDSTLQINRRHNLNNNFGIAGDFNHNGNDGTITRFGWKAQNKSLHIFAGEAYNVEMGISNLLFPNDRPLPGEDGSGGSGGVGLPANCLNLTTTGYPEDNSNPVATNSTNNAAAVLDDVSTFANFMRSLAPPPRGGVVLNGSPVSAASLANGESLFTAIGCATCHNPSPGKTQMSNFTPSLNQAQVNAFSDIELHHMGVGLADNVAQGTAGGDQFRTSPLWGLGQRIFLLHDGRTTNLLRAIEAHASNGSEANQVEQTFDALPANMKQDLLNFLRSL
jgi:CxxC motif-containing protein (DUF1111 family)